MPHDIDTSTGEAAVMTTHTSGGGGVPWHGLGVTIDAAATSAEAITLAKLDWRVAQRPVLAVDVATGTTTRCPDHVANVRLDTQAVLGVVGRRYRPFQNVEAFEFFDAIIGENLAFYETAGALNGGRRVWMLAKLPRELYATDEDLIKTYVLLTNAHDGSMALRMIPTSVRVVCSNTLNLALQKAGGADGIAIKHRPGLRDRVDEAREKLGLVTRRIDRFETDLRRLLSVYVTPRKAIEYFHDVVPAPPTSASPRAKNAYTATMRRLVENLDDSTNAMQGVRGTAWAAYNAVSEYADHQRRFKGQSGRERAENRLKSAWFGTGHELKTKAFEKALALSN